jgi:hypothetical protein
MWQRFTATILGLVVGSAAILSAADDQKPQIKGGIEGKVKKVDVETKTLTITTLQGRDRTFSINDETTMVGPRGGKVRRGLKDPRFHEGMSLTIVAEGNTATEVHLGFQHTKGEEKTRASDADASDRIGRKDAPERTAKKTAPPVRDDEAKSEVKTTSRGKAAPRAADEDDDLEVPGKIKKFDATRHILVLTLLSGKDRSFILSKDVKVLVRGAASKRGLEDPALKTGASIEVITDEGGHKVKELKIVPASPRRKAG